MTRSLTQDEIELLKRYAEEGVTREMLFESASLPGCTKGNPCRGHHYRCHFCGEDDICDEERHPCPNYVITGMQGATGIAGLQGASGVTGVWVGDSTGLRAPEGILIEPLRDFSDRMGVPMPSQGREVSE